MSWIFFFQEVTQTQCVKWELPVCDFPRMYPLSHCLAGRLLQAPLAWLPSLRDQGLPRCYWERGRSGRMGTTQTTKYSFPLHVRYPQLGLRQGHWHLVPEWMFVSSLLLMKTVALHCARSGWVWCCNLVMPWDCPKETVIWLCPGSAKQQYLI